MELNNNLCGLLSWHPPWLQKFANSKSYLMVYGLLGTTQAMAMIYFTSVMTTIEKRFQIPGYLMGFILCGNELSQILLSLILSYMGGQRNRPRWISTGVFFCALSCFVLALPHALYGGGEEALKYTKEYGRELELNDTEIILLNKRHNGLCLKSDEGDSCDDMNKEPYVTPLLLIFLSQFVLGIGNSLYYSLGQTYLDDNVKKTKTPLLLGYALFLKTLGPGLGFVLGYSSLKMYIDPTKTPTINYKDKRWLGAWWLGWVILGIVMTIFAILVGMFPKELPKLEEKAKNEDEINDQSISEQLKESIPAFKRLIKNKILVCNTLSSFFAILGSNSYLIFMAKYVETQFHKTRSESSIVTGPIALLGLALGFLLSGLVISRYQPRAKYLLLYNVIVGGIYIFGHIGNLFLFCSSSEDRILSNNSMMMNFTRDCNLECNCQSSTFNPICNENQAFFSPCHAGCESYDEKLKEFYDCSCLNDDSMSTRLGVCLKGCGYGFLIFTTVAAFNNFLSASGRIGNTLVNYRCISKKDKSSAQGFILMIVSLASLLSPIIFANIMDSTCLLWTNQACGQRGSCQIYDQKMFRYKFNGIAVIFSTIAVILDYFVWQYGKEMTIYGTAEDKIDEKVDDLTKSTETVI